MATFYKFPKITRIEPLLELIKDRKEFILAEREDFNIINYVVNLKDTFPPIGQSDDAILLRECRGIAFDKHGDILSRTMHKFFNLGEREETLPQNVEFNVNHQILEKMDGSFIRPLFIKRTGEFRVGTKMGLTDTAANAEEFVKCYPKYYHLFNFCYDMGLTPTFEWCSLKNRIVINYEKDDLILIAVRYLHDGKYMSYDNMQHLASRFDISCVKSWGDNVNSFENYRDNPLFKGMEGFVVRFDNGHMLKMKTDEYCLMHKSNDIINSKRQMIELILDNEIDDIKPRLIPEDLKRVEDMESLTSIEIAKFAEVLDKEFVKYKDMSKKDFALFEAPKLVPYIRTGVFSLMNGESSIDLATQFIRKNITQDIKFEKLKEEYGIFDKI